MGADQLMQDVPPPPPGFVADDDPPRRKDKRASADEYRIAQILASPDGRVHDGDTFRLRGGPNARLFGVDAFELPQRTKTIAELLIPAGENARQTLSTYADPQATVTSAGKPSYGRPVVTLNGAGGDAGRGLISSGWAVPELTYLAADPARRDDYLHAQRDAIADERGAYAGTYQLPRDYRRQGDAAPWRGKVAMSPVQQQEYERLVRDPATTPEALSAWLASQGHAGENAHNILSFMRNNPSASPMGYFQQQDAAGQPVMTNGPGIFTRSISALNEGIADTLGAPVDLVQMGLRPIEGWLGITPPEKPFLGSDWIRDRFHDVGIGQLDESYAPRSDAERYWQPFMRGTGAAAVPFAGSIGFGSKLATRTPSAITAASPMRSAIRDGLTDAARNPGTAAALEFGSSIGSYEGGQVADDLVPGNPYARIAGQMVGGLGGGFAAGRAAGAGRARPGEPTSGSGIATADDAIYNRFNPDDPIIERNGQLFARAADGAEVPIPVDASGHPGITWADDHWEALVGVEDGAPTYGPQGASNSIASPYGDLTQRLNARPMGRPDAAANQTDVPPPPPGFEIDNHTAAMGADFERPTLMGPRDIDRIDVSSVPPPRPLSPVEQQARDNVPAAGDLLPRATAASDRAGNINLANLDSPENIDRALNAASDATGGFADNRRGVVSHAETERLAADMGMTADDLLRRRRGQALNAEQALAARQILAKSGDELVTLAQRVQAMDNPGDELLAQFRQAWVRHVAIQEQVAGATAEAGRALSQFRMMADSRLAKGQVLSGLVHEGGGADRLKDAARLITDGADDPSAINDITRRALKPKFSDKLVELYYNSLLSGPQTHAVNVMSNTMTSLAQIPEHAVAAGVGAMRRVLPSQRETDAVLFSELGARATGLMQGIKEGLPQAWRTMRTGQPSDFVSKAETRYPNAISGVKGSIIRTPTRALAAEDELFKSMARRMELGGLSVRQAAKEGLTGEAAKARAAELMANPTDEMLDRAFDYGQYLTFQSDLGPVGQGVQRITQSMPVLKLVLPFIKTPTNLLKFTLERSPAAPLLKEWRADVKAGGARRDLAVAKAMVGSGMMALVTELVSQGHITGGGPADEDAKALMRANGWQPYSVKLGDKYYSYQRMDPFSSTIGIAADLVDLQGHMTDKQREETATLLVAATLKNMSNKTWLSGLTDLTEAINDPDRSAKRFLARMAGSLAVPAGVAQVARVYDPVLREAETGLDRIRSRIPGLSEALEPKRDVWGQPITSEGGLGPDIISPVWQSTDKRDPVTEALLGFGGHVGAPSKTVGDRQLTPQEYGRYREEIGERARPVLSTMIGINDPVAAALFNSLPIDERRDMVSDALSGVRRGVRKEMFGGGKGDGKRSIAEILTEPPPPSGFVLDR